jgi:hypothetical protein
MSDGGPDKDMATGYCEPGREGDDVFRSLVHEPSLLAGVADLEDAV